MDPLAKYGCEAAYLSHSFCAKDIHLRGELARSAVKLQSTEMAARDRGSYRLVSEHEVLPRFVVHRLGSLTWECRPSLLPYDAKSVKSPHWWSNVVFRWWRPQS